MNVGQFLNQKFQGRIDVCLYVDKTAATPSAMVELQVLGDGSANESIAVAHWLAAHVHLRTADDERWIVSVEQLARGRARLRFVLMDRSDAQLIRAIRAIKGVLESVPLFGVEPAVPTEALRPRPPDAARSPGPVRSREPFLPCAAE